MALIQSWADAFRSDPNMRYLCNVYQDMVLQGTEFPAQVWTAAVVLDFKSPSKDKQRGRERQRETERDRERQRETERQKGRAEGGETERDRERQRERQREPETRAHSLTPRWLAGTFTHPHTHSHTLS